MFQDASLLSLNFIKAHERKLENKQKSFQTSPLRPERKKTSS